MTTAYPTHEKLRGNMMYQKFFGVRADTKNVKESERLFLFVELKKDVVAESRSIAKVTLEQGTVAQVMGFQLNLEKGKFNLLLHPDYVIPLVTCESCMAYSIDLAKQYFEGDKENETTDIKTE